MLSTVPNQASTATLENSNPLLAAHYKELVEKRSLPLDWVLANCKSISIQKATELLGYPAKSPGILLQGDGWQLQFKPDKPWLSGHDTSAGKKRSPKYRTPQEYSGDYDCILPSHPSEKAFWRDMEALKERAYKVQGHPCLLVTEGVFKAISGTSHGIPTIALLGVEMGLTSSKNDPQGRRYLVASLARLVEAGFGFIIAFDADCVANRNVLQAERTLTHQLRKFDVPVYTITGKWDAEDGKGMDDYINQQGIEEFRSILLKAEEKKQEEGEGEKKKCPLPPASETAYELAERYREKLAWESEYKLWRHYGAKHDGMWSEETPESVRGLVHAYLRTLPDSPPFNAGYVSSVVTILQSDLEIKEWNEQKGLIPLRDGVLNQETLELNPHSPSYRFTWQLPYKWEDSSIGCQPIEDFLLKVTGNSAIAEVLLAYLSAIVTRRSDLQRYLELIGGGGTGKSTFMGLGKELAGEENTVTSRLSQLEGNRFETARFRDKLLVLFPDSERWQGEVSVLKQMTGQDPIRYERKGIQQCKDFIFNGMVVQSANEAPASSDYTSGQERRKLTIGLNKRISDYEGRNLLEEFKPFLPGLLKRVLEIPRERVTALIKYTERNVPELAVKKWAQLVETNPIAAWVDECLIIDPNAKAYIGKDSLDLDEARRKNWLYPDFLLHQRESGHKSSMPVKRFSPNLLDLLKNQMKVAVVKGKDRNGAYIQGIGLRSHHDPNGTRYPLPITGQCDGFVMDCDESVMVETLASDGCDGCDGFLQVHTTRESLADLLTPAEIDECLGVSSENASHPSHPLPASTSPVADASPEIVESVTVPASVTSEAEEIPIPVEHPVVTEPVITTGAAVTEAAVTEVVEALPAIGWWAMIEGKLAQVVAHYPHGVSFKGEGIYGVCRNYRLLTTTEMLQQGLSWTSLSK